MANNMRTLGPFYADKYVICPLNKEHIILESRLQYHIIRCLKSFPHKERVQKCPFNSTHLVVLPDNLEQHMASCPDSSSLLMFKHSGGGSSNVMEGVLPVSDRQISCDEDWSDSCRSPAYNFLKEEKFPVSCKYKNIKVEDWDKKVRKHRNKEKDHRKKDGAVTCNPRSAGKVSITPSEISSYANSSFTCSGGSTAAAFFSTKQEQ